MVEGQHSDRVPVTSGVPQGLVLGPCLFLHYINDLPEGIRSSVRLFADDTVMYLTITNLTHSHQLQAYLDHLAKWETTWQIKFHLTHQKYLKLCKQSPWFPETKYVNKFHPSQRTSIPHLRPTHTRIFIYSLGPIYSISAAPTGNGLAVSAKRPVLYTIDTDRHQVSITC